MDALDTIVRNVLKLGPDDPANDACWATHGQWTSLKHVQIIISIEDEYDVAFTGEEMASADSVKRLRELLAEKGVTP